MYVRELGRPRANRLARARCVEAPYPAPTRQRFSEGNNETHPRIDARAPRGFLHIPPNSDCLRVHPRNRVSTRAGSDEIVDSAMEFHRFASVKRAAPFRVQLALHHARPVSKKYPRRVPPGRPAAVHSARESALGRHCGRRWTTARLPVARRADETLPSRAHTPPGAAECDRRRDPPFPALPPKGTRPARPLRSAARRRISPQSRSVPRLGGRCRPWTRRSRVPRTWTPSS